MTKHDWFRFWLHFPVGLLAILLFIVNPFISLCFFIGFLVYEVMNDWRKVDSSYKDIFGFLAGFAVGAITLGIGIKLFGGALLWF